jgi:S1-C subfamily serine protease
MKKSPAPIKNVGQQVLVSLSTTAAVLFCRDLRASSLIRHELASSVALSSTELVRDRLSSSPRAFQESERSVGSGFRVRSGNSVVILTNAHVVENAYGVYEAPGLRAEVLYQDRSNDIAILASSRENGEFARLCADDEPPVVGAHVNAVGNPFGLGLSLTSGVLSGTDQIVVDSPSHVYLRMLQSDAAINPGNSGGPLFDADRGCVMGMSSVQVRDGQGVGFAIPAKVLRKALESRTVGDGAVDFGFRFLDEQVADALGIQGVVVVDPSEESRLVGTSRDALGRLVFGDIIVGFREGVGGPVAEVRSVHDLLIAWASTEKEVFLRVLRGGGAAEVPWQR